MVRSARLDAFIAQDALAVVTDVQVVVHFGRLRDRGGVVDAGWSMMPWNERVALTGSGGWRGRSEAFRLRLVFMHPPVHMFRRGEIDRRREHLEHQLAAE